MVDRSGLCVADHVRVPELCDNRCTGTHSNNNPATVLPAVAVPIPSPGKMGPTVIDKSKPIELVRFKAP